MIQAWEKGYMEEGSGKAIFQSGLEMEIRKLSQGIDSSFRIPNSASGLGLLDKKKGEF
jgi:hypothetical protein